MLNFAAIIPHPPLIIPTIGQPSDLKKVSRTIEAMETLSDVFAKEKIETVIVVSPHGPMLYDYFAISSSPTLSGNFRNFGDFETELSFKNDLELVSLLEKERKDKKVPLQLIKNEKLDHGTLVPLYFLTKKMPDIKIVSLSFSYLDTETHFQFGQMLQKVASNKLKAARIAIVASGDLSHRLIPGAPAGFSPQGKEFDEKLVELLKKKDTKGILQIDTDLLEDAGECGYRAIVILLGVLSGLKWEPEILSYEGPFGVGYLVANFRIEK